jgi:hypothetical protein
MINFRVADLDKMAASGIVVEIDRQSYPNGRFASCGRWCKEAAEKHLLAADERR